MARSNFGSRLAVAAVGLPLVLGMAWLGGWWLAILVLVGAILAADELWRLARDARPLAPAGYAGVVLAVLAAQLGGVQWLPGAVAATVALGFLVRIGGASRAPALAGVGGVTLAAAWIGLGFAYLVLVRDTGDHGRLALYTVLLSVWAGDTLAYVGGRLFGRHRMAPAVSPGKTWEGFLLGTAATIFVAFVCLYKQHYLSVGESIVLGTVIAFAAPAGDLFESLVKRDVDAKDSGRLLGGHGGVLDRVDALLFAAPAAYYTIAAFGHG
jgi:phosphatidate cytidylyltransferase